MAGDWLSIVRSKGGKASAPNQTESHVEQVATLYLRTAQVWITKVKVCMYVPSWRTCLRWLEALPGKGRRQAPKRGRSQGHTINSCMVSTREETRRKAHVLTPRKMDARNGVTRR